MRRREFISLLSSAAALWPLAARAQQTAKKIPVVGVLWHAASAEQEDVYLSVLHKGFADLGYVEGKNIVLEHRFPAEQPERFRVLARELVDLQPDALIAVTPLGAVELKKLTSSIPIVFILIADPVGFGLVQSLSHPGGNATGLSIMTIDLSGKRLSLLKEAVPHLSRVAVLSDGTDPFRDRFIEGSQGAADSLGLLLLPIEIASTDDIERAFAKIAKERADAVIWGPGRFLFVERDRLGKALLAQKLPAIAGVGEEVPAGALMSYGQDFPDYFRRAASYVDKILKGAKSADLPVEQPTQFKLIINLKVAKALEVAIPASLLVTADELIE